MRIIITLIFYEEKNVNVARPAKNENYNSFQEVHYRIFKN